MDIIELRKGEELEGTVKDKSFTILTDDVGKLDLPTKTIGQILFASPGSGGVDEIESDGGTYKGKIQNTTVTMELDDTGKDVIVDTAKILAVQLNN